MALTVEAIRQITALKDLQEDQINAIVTASQNDEVNVLATNKTALFKDLDDKVAALVGVAKGDKESSIDFIVGKLTALKKDADVLATTKTELETTKNSLTELEQKIKDGKGNEALTQKYNDLEQKYNTLTGNYSTLEQKYNDSEKEFTGKLLDAQTGSAYSTALAGMTLKKEFEGVADILKNDALGKLKAEYKPEFTEDGKLQFRDKDNKIALNTTTMQPLTASDILTSKLDAQRDKGRQAGGAGSKGGGAGAGEDKTAFLDMSGVSTKLQADSVIRKYLGETGITPDKTEYNQQFQELRETHGVGDMPAR